MQIAAEAIDLSAILQSRDAAMSDTSRDVITVERLRFTLFHRSRVVVADSKESSTDHRAESISNVVVEMPFCYTHAASPYHITQHSSCLSILLWTFLVNRSKSIEDVVER